MPKPINHRPPLGCCDFSVVHSSVNSIGDVFTYYDKIRSYIQHEDGLVNSRLTWSLTIHGFLFAIYGLLEGKIADQFLSIAKPGGSLLVAENIISALFLLQLPVATFGLMVGLQSRRAIVAAHNAIQHLFAISEASALLTTRPVLPRLVKAIVQGGQQSLQLDSYDHISCGTSLLVEPGSDELQEIVVATVLPTGEFAANFAHTHSMGVEVRPLSPVLLPKVIAGGDQGLHTGGARSYYLALPLYAVWMWTTLCIVAAFLSVVSICWRGRFFAILGVPS